MSSPLLAVQEVYKAHVMGHEKVRVLRGAAMTAEEGEFLVVTGASGSGKSTLLHLLGALDKPDKGTIRFSGKDLMRFGDRERRRYRMFDVGFVFQFYHLLPELNVLENIVIPKMVASGWLSWRTRKHVARREALDLADRVGLNERLRHRPRELSGGERQRVAIARALINKPRLLLADEPTGNLDRAIGGEILALMSELNQAGQTILMVTHDPIIACHAHRRLHLANGVLAEASLDEPFIAADPLATADLSPKAV